MAEPIASNVPVYVTELTQTNELVFSAAYNGKLWPLAVQKAGLQGLDDEPSSGDETDAEQQPGDQPQQQV